MRSLISLATVCCLFILPAMSAQPLSPSASTITTLPADSSNTSPLSILLEDYYNLKNALVNSDAATAAAKAGDLLKAVNAVDMKALSPKEHDAFMPLQTKLAYDARHISEVQKIDHQREHFGSLSANMASLAKAVKLSSDKVYEAYCPMQKSYWLSKEAAIKNPYYGKQMLTCGKVTSTL